MDRELVGGLQGALIGWLATESDGRDIPEETRDPSIMIEGPKVVTDKAAVIRRTGRVY